MSIIHSKKARQEKKKKLWEKIFGFFKKKESKTPRNVYLGEQKLKHYRVTHNANNWKLHVIARTNTEARDKAYELLRHRYPNKKIKIKNAWEVDVYE